jgi:hypothetical protein
MIFSLERREIWLLAGALGLLALALFGPAVSQPADYHAFADQRSLLGLPYAMDVLTNLPFALWALVGAGCLWRVPAAALSRAERAMAGLFFAGLFLTALCSTWYHWLPNDAGLAIDRCGMVFAFAGLMGLATAGHISARAGWMLAGAMVVLGLVSVGVWVTSGNVLPWAVLQFGGMVLVLWLASLKALPGALAVRWGMVILVYAVAKGLEMGDHAVYAWSDGWVSGHSLKHVVASLSAWPLVHALAALRHRGTTMA